MSLYNLLITLVGREKITRRIPDADNEQQTFLETYKQTSPLIFWETELWQNQATERSTDEGRSEVSSLHVFKALSLLAFMFIYCRYKPPPPLLSLSGYMYQIVESETVDPCVSLNIHHIGKCFK